MSRYHLLINELNIHEFWTVLAHDPDVVCWRRHAGVAFTHFNFRDNEVYVPKLNHWVVLTFQEYVSKGLIKQANNANYEKIELARIRWQNQKDKSKGAV